jgi:IS4 transposase
MELSITLGAIRLPCRLVAIKLDDEAYQKRLKNLTEKRRKDPRIKEKINDILNYWSIFITNLPVSISPRKILLIYSLRWQIELLFKAIKTFLNLRSISDSSKPRSQISLYISLIAMMLISLVIITITRKEISLYKACRIFAKNVREFIEKINEKEKCAVTWLRELIVHFALKESRKKRPSTKKSPGLRPSNPLS